MGEVLASSDRELRSGYLGLARKVRRPASLPNWQGPDVFRLISNLRGMLRDESVRTSYRAALRYRFGGDALRFVCETQQELPPQPPPGRRTLVLFAHFDAQGVVDPYVVYYLKALHRLGATIVFVSGSPSLTPESVAPLRELCAGIYTRHTLSLDFGSWHLAWCILRQRGWPLDQCDRF